MAVLHEARTEIGDFKKFILRGNVVDLAVGVVSGHRCRVRECRSGDCQDILNPLMSALGGKADVSDLLPPSEEVASAMRQVAAPSGADIADHAARVLADRLQGNGPERR